MDRRHDREAWTYNKCIFNRCFVLFPSFFNVMCQNRKRKLILLSETTRENCLCFNFPFFLRKFTTNPRLDVFDPRYRWFTSQAFLQISYNDPLLPEGRFYWGEGRIVFWFARGMQPMAINNPTTTSSSSQKK